MSTVLFEDGDWRIRRAGFSGGGANSIIQHRCPSYYGVKTQAWWYYTDGTQCVTCNAAIPEALIGLKALHEWDR